MNLKKNLIANYAGVAWSSVINIIFLPIYMHYLGPDGYGLIGFYTLISISLSCLDIGFGAVATREAAGYLDAKDQRKYEIATLLKSLEILFYAISIIAGVLVISFASLMVKYWLKVPEKMMIEAVWSIRFMGIAIAIQFPASFYCGCLNGFQKQLGINLTNIIGYSIRGGGAILALWMISPSVEIFFAWQAIGSLGMLIVFRALYLQNIDVKSRNLKFSRQSLMSVYQFLRGMGIITATSFLLTNLDKIILSTTLSLAAFGYYSLAWLLGNTVMGRLSGPVFNAYYPRIAQLKEGGNTELMMKSYEQGCKAMSIIAVPFSLWLALYSHSILLVWTKNNTLADEAFGALSVIAIGTMINVFMQIPYAIQLAHYLTRIAILQNTIAIFFISPLTWYLATNYSLTIAALPWVIINVIGLFFVVPLIYKRLNLPGLKHWYGRVLIIPILYAGGTMLATKLFWFIFIGDGWFIFLLPISLAIGLIATAYSLEAFSYIKLRKNLPKTMF